MVSLMAGSTRRSVRSLGISIDIKRPDLLSSKPFKKSSVLKSQHQQQLSQIIQTQTSHQHHSHHLTDDELLIIEEVDIDNKIVRCAVKETKAAKNPTSISTDHSRIYIILQNGFPLDLPEDMYIPNFDTMEPKDCLDYLGRKLGCEDHEENLASFWILDILCEIIRQGQLNGVKNYNLKVICVWFAHLLKVLSVEGLPRVDFFNYVNDLLTEAEDLYLKAGKLPYPQDLYTYINRFRGLGDQYQSDYIKNKRKIKTQSKDRTNKTDSIGDKLIGDKLIGDVLEDECSRLNELEFLTKQLFGVFANQFKFEVIRSVFALPPEIIPVVVVDCMNFPKELGMSLKNIELTIRKKYQKAQSTKDTKKKTGPKESKKNKKNDKDREEQTAISDAVENFKRELEELDLTRELAKEIDNTKYDYIKPLEDAVDDSFFEKLFPEEDILLSEVTKSTGKKGNTKKK